MPDPRRVLTDTEVIEVLHDHGWAGMTTAQAVEVLHSKIPEGTRIPSHGDLVAWMEDAGVGVKVADRQERRGTWS